MAPYRTTSNERPAETPRDTGIVGDVIGQFADPLAFYRELVQNSIDARTPSIEIALTHDGRAVRIVVTDRGEGMSRDTIEDQLLVLFRSTKEHDPTKIGKFGIGFASVLAQAPEVVIVTSAREGRRLVLHLHRDLTFQLFDAGPATQAGTSVELQIPMPIEVAHDLAHRSLAAVTRWCRHARVPIRFEARLDGLEPPLSARIDRPLALDGALVEVHGTTPDGQLTAIVGFTAPPEPAAAFFNHGLTLWETREPLLGRLQLKVQDSRLGHTLSRDNVRRDEHFRRAITFARALARRELPALASQVLRGAAEAGDHARHVALASAIRSAGIALSLPQWSWPIVEPLAGRRSIDLGSLRAFGRRAWGGRRTKLAATLASAGIPVLLVEPSETAWLRELLCGDGVTKLADPETELVGVTPIELTPADLVLLDAVIALLAACHRAPTNLVIARLDGAHDQRLSITGGLEDALHADDQSWVLERQITGKNPFALLRARALVLSADHLLVRHARGADDPELAASHLARALLMQHGLLDPDRSAKLLELTLGRALAHVGAPR